MKKLTLLFAIGLSYSIAGLGQVEHREQAKIHTFGLPAIPAYYSHADTSIPQTFKWQHFKKRKLWQGSFGADAAAHLAFGRYMMHYNASQVNFGTPGALIPEKNEPAIWPSNAFFSSFISRHSITIRQNTALGQLNFYYDPAKYRQAFNAYPFLYNKRKDQLIFIASNLLMRSLQQD